MINDWCNAYWLLIDVQCFGFGLMLCEMVFDWFICWVLDKSGSSIEVLCGTHLMNHIVLPRLTQPHVLLQVGFFKSCVIHSFNTHLSPSSHSAHRPWTATSFFKNSSLTLMSFCTKGLPGVAESTVFIAKEILLPVGKGARQCGWGLMDKGSFPAVTDCLQGIPFSLRAILKLQNLGFQLLHLNLTKKSFQGGCSESEDGSQPHLFTESFHFPLGRFFRFLRYRPEDCRQEFHLSHRIEEEFLVG